MMYEFIHYQAKDVMTRDPITVYQNATFTEVETIFEEHDFNGLPVVDEDFRLIGMVTKLSILKGYALTKRVEVRNHDTIMDQQISGLMTQEPIAFEPDTPLTRILEKMIETRHKSFPVVEGDHFVGIIAREDVLEAIKEASLGNLPERLLSSEKEAISEVSNY